MGNPRRPPAATDADDVHVAARCGDLQKVQSICSANPLAINSRDRHSRTPLYVLDITNLKLRLHLAAWSGHTEVVSYLCKNTADIGAAAMDDTAAIHFASQKGHLEVVRVLLNSGVSVKATNRKGMTALHFASQGSNLELVKYLVRKGSNLTAKNKSGQTPLDVAEKEEVRKYLEECKQMLKKGEDPATNQTTKENSEASDVKDRLEQAQGGEGEVKEKREAEDAAQGSLLRGKKQKVSLAHLEAEDDLEDVNEA